MDPVNVHSMTLPTGSFNIFISTKPWLFLVTGHSIITGQQREVITEPDLSCQQNYNNITLQCY